MNPSKLRHRITFQEQTETQNDYGEEIKDWEDVVTVWASIDPISAKEFFAAEKMNSEVSHKVDIRYTNIDITPDMRIKYYDLKKKKDRYFELTAPPINFQERNIELQLLCKELF